MSYTWRDGFLRIATDRSIGAECYRVLFAVLASLEDEYFSPVTPVRVARMVGMHESGVKRALRVLIAQGIIRKRYHPSGKLIGYEVVEFFGASDS